MAIKTRRRHCAKRTRGLQRTNQVPRLGALKWSAPRLARRSQDPRVKQLSFATDEIAIGRFRIDVPTGRDELGKLGRSLERLAEKFGGRLEQLLRLLRLSEGINSATTLEDALDYLYYSFRSVIPYDRMGCALLDADEQTVTSVWARARVAPQELPVGYSANLTGSSLEPLLKSHQPRILGDLEAYLEEHPESESTRLIVAEGIKSSLTCPVFAVGRPVGFLFFSSCERSAYSAAHVDFYQQISRVVGMVIDRARLYEEVTLARDSLADANSKLQAMVDVDGLTMIPNRRAFDHRLDTEWRRARRAGTSLSVLMVDVDDFKRYNDTYGHLAGDQCLKSVAAALAASLRRAGDFVARFGGEEFALILPGIHHLQLQAVAERCLQAVRGLGIPHATSRGGSVVTLSIGGATWDGEGEMSPTDLLRQADDALYGAKDLGRNACSLASQSVQPKSIPEIRLV